MRQFSPVTTIGGGVILDNHPTWHRLGDRSVSDFLSALAQADSEKSLELLVEKAGEATQSAMVARTGLKPDEVLRLAKQLEVQKRLLILPQSDTLLVSTGRFGDLSAGLPPNSTPSIGQILFSLDFLKTTCGPVPALARG